MTQKHLHPNHSLHLVQVVAAVCFVPLTSSSHSICEDSFYVPRDIFFLNLWFTALLASCFFSSQHTCDLWSLKKEVCLLPPLLLKRMSYALRKHRAAKWERKRRSERDPQPMRVGVFFTSVGLADALRMHAVSGGRSSWACALLLASLQLWGTFHTGDVS